VTRSAIEAVAAVPGFDEITAGYKHGSRGYKAIDGITSLKGLFRAEQIGKLLNKF